MEIKSGDIFMVDSNKTGAKIVKFLQTAPTVWQHFWRKIRGTQEEVLYYHVGMFVNKDEIIEQQSKVVTKSSEKLLNTTDRLLIVRKKGLTVNDREKLLKEAFDDIGKGYDILNIVGKTLTWVTRIKWFARYVEYPDKEICINRVAQWYKNAVNEKFGAKTHSELTTHLMYKCIKNNPDLFEIIHEGILNK